ncbi:hypothetical protein BDV97DRAFT_365233 [Delphinella strobiligena]|nr:hypothetical protein BDV97DRAFT_365233 [Delphinella strobiligena]
MADHDEEDLFADLYENDDAPATAPAAPPPAPAATAEPEHPAGSEQTDAAPVAAEPASIPDPIANGSNGAANYDQSQRDSYGNGYEQESHDQNMQGGQNYDYNNNNQGNDYGAPQHQQQQHQEEDYKPIGIKEDGLRESRRVFASMNSLGG